MDTTRFLAQHTPLPVATCIYEARTQAHVVSVPLQANERPTGKEKTHDTTPCASPKGKALTGNRHNYGCISWGFSPSCTAAGERPACRCMKQAPSPSGLAALPYKHSAGLEPSHTRSFRARHFRPNTVPKHGRCDGSRLVIRCIRSRKLLDHRDLSRGRASWHMRRDYAK